MMRSATLAPPPAYVHPTPSKAKSLPLHLLDAYTNSHPLRSPSPLPASSRVDPKLTQRLPPPTSSSPLLWTIPTWWAFAQFAVAKGISIIWSLVSHFLWGPQRESWGYRMTFIVSFMRNVAQHTSLADIVLIRRLISFHSLIPLPADAVVTPITFVVPRRTGEDVARGFLREWDVVESGSRELTGEWVVGTDVWRRLKSERRARQEASRRQRRGSPHQPSPLSTASEPSPYRGRTGLNGISAPSIESPGQDLELDGTDSISGSKSAQGEKVIYYVHGGAYYVGNAATHRLITIGVSKACNARVFAITYRLAPENAFPLPLHDVLQGYLRLLAPPLSILPENIIIAGDSAGGGLSLALCMYLRDEGYKSPAGLVLMSPWVDLTMSCGSWDENADTDVVPRPDPDDHLNPVGCYLGPEGISTYVTHPYASPLFGDLRNLPPMLIQSGDSEVLRDEITLLAHKASLAGANVTHELYEDMIHVFQMFTWLPSAKVAIDSVGRWVRVTLPKIEDEMRRDGVDLSAGRNFGGPSSTSAGGDQAGEMIVERSRVVSADGEEVGGNAGVGNSHALPEELAAVTDRQRSMEVNGSLHLNIPRAAESYQRPSIDTDSLGAMSDSGSGSGSGSKTSSGSATPTNSRSRSPTMQSTSTGRLSPDLFSPTDPAGARPVLPTLRRAHTAMPTAYSPLNTSPPTISSQSMRRRRPTVGSASLHASPAHSTYAPSSHPVSPTPSLRLNLNSILRSPTLRSPTLGHGRHLSSAGLPPQPTPSTRARRASHVDINHLVDGYMGGGAANETVVYGAKGEVRSVGVLGEEPGGE